MSTTPYDKELDQLEGPGWLYHKGMVRLDDLRLLREGWLACHAQHEALRTFANLAGDAIEALRLAALVAQSAAVTDSLNAILVRAKALEASHA